MSKITEASPLSATSCERDRSGGRRITKQKLPAGIPRGVCDIAMGCVIHKTDQFLVDFGYEGTDAYAKNGSFIVEAAEA